MSRINRGDIHGKTAVVIHDRGAFKFGAFKLKLHDLNPKAPLSPFYIDMRDRNNPKPGPLEGVDYDQIALSIWQAIHESGVVFDAIAPIPNAGDPIVDALDRVMIQRSLVYQGDFRIIRLKKEVLSDGTRKIVPLPGFEYREGERILLVDDLVTQADTKLEAIKAIESSGSRVVAVVVLIDREQGGKEQLEKAGYKLFAAFTVTELAEFYVDQGRIDMDKYWEVKNYVQSQRV